MENNEQSVEIFLEAFVKRHSKPYWFRSSHFTRLALIEYAKEVTPPAGIDREELIRFANWEQQQIEEQMRAEDEENDLNDESDLTEGQKTITI